MLLALMASGMNGQSFAFHGYLPVAPRRAPRRCARWSGDSRAAARTQLFIETPYRNEAMLRRRAAVLPRRRRASASPPI